MIKKKEKEVYILENFKKLQDGMAGSTVKILKVGPSLKNVWTSA